MKKIITKIAKTALIVINAIIMTVVFIFSLLIHFPYYLFSNSNKNN